VSERYASQLASGNTVFKVESPFYNYYSRFFVPYKHYIPVKYDLSDLIEKVSTQPFPQGPLPRPKLLMGSAALGWASSDRVGE
jgi:hypothetical protein